jgi:hypothetical protein
MSFESNVNIYQSLMRRFLARDVSAGDFVLQFIELWKRDRDEEDHVRLTWDRPYDQELIKQHQSGALTDGELSEQWRRLWGISEPGAVLRGVLDRVFTACDVFNENPERASYELDEAGLRSEVQHLIVELKAANQALNPTGNKPAS